MRAFHRFHRHLGVEADKPGGKSAVLLAFAAGTSMALVKSVAAVLTGSASMTAEAVHSWVDALTDSFLVAAYLAARRPADARRRLGYGRESYVWSMFGSIAMLALGAQVGIWRGIRQLGMPDATTDYRLGYAVILGSFALQSISTFQALRFLRRRASDRQLSAVRHVFETSDSQLRTVVTQDLLALVGLAVAGLGMLLHDITGNVVYDAGGSIVVGLLMGIAGVFLVNLNRRYLAGMPLPADRRATAIVLLKQSPDVKRVTHLFTEFIGPDRILLAARIEIAGEHSQAELGTILRRLEQQVMAHRNVGLATLTLSAPDEEDIRD
ncbi:cation diffusion facilitator family transporter [Variovorax sp. GT1P44]|uniref:cation diffusion facilitator family transporter n=1 Tax=Variovorax sp. GT1P44 TaxID=3443742 RepID=UPI003F4606EF